MSSQDGRVYLTSPGEGSVQTRQGRMPTSLIKYQVICEEDLKKKSLPADSTENLMRGVFANLIRYKTR